MTRIDKARRDMYLGLSLCFSYPSGRLVAVASAGLLSQAWRELSLLPAGECENGGMAEFIRPLEAEIGLTEGEPLLDLRVEYTRLFVGPASPEVVPYESLFLNRASSVINHSNLSLLQAYRQEGVTIAPPCQDLPDHIAIELEFMGYLCHQQALAKDHQDERLAQHYRRRQRSFFQQHVINWAPMLLTEIELAAELDFYRSLARATGNFLEWESSRLAAARRAEERRS